MRTFKLVRTEDASGVSGTGEVAEGVEFKNGKCVMCWDTKTSSVAVYENITDLVAIHGHEGRTKAVFQDGAVVSDLKSLVRGDRVKVVKAQSDGSFSEWEGLKATVLQAELDVYGEDYSEIAFDETTPDNSERIRKWRTDWLMKV